MLSCSLSVSFLPRFGHLCKRLRSVGTAAPIFLFFCLASKIHFQVLLQGTAMEHGSLPWIVPQTICTFFLSKVGQHRHEVFEHFTGGCTAVPFEHKLNFCTVPQSVKQGPGGATDERAPCGFPLQKAVSHAPPWRG